MVISDSYVTVYRRVNPTTSMKSPLKSPLTSHWNPIFHIAPLVGRHGCHGKPGAYARRITPPGADLHRGQRGETVFGCFWGNGRGRQGVPKWLIMVNQGLVNVPFWGFVSHHQNKYLLEMKYPHFCWVMWNIRTFTNPCSWGGSINGGYPKWMVYKGKSPFVMDD